MAKTLTIDDATARRIYPSADAELKAILEENYSKAFFSQDIMDRIKTFEDACEYNNTNPKARKFVVGTRNQIYQERVAEIVKALNEGWLANYNDSSQYKYGPYFRLDGPSGFRFFAARYDLSYSDTTGGSRFALRSEKLARYAGQQFVKEYEYWLMPQAHSSHNFASAAFFAKPFIGDIKAWETHIMAIVKTFEDACRETGEDPEDYKFQEGEADEIAYKKGKVVVRALNGHNLLNWKDQRQRKWQAWLEHDGTGFRFDVTFFDVSLTCTSGGSRLRLCSEVLAKYFATQFPDLMMPFWL